jgi:bile acid:Na+ symporter, BASS family
MTETLLLVLKLSVVALIFGVGLGATAADLAYLWRRPRQLARSLVAMYVVVPLVLLLLTRVLPMTTAVRTAVLVLAVSAGAPLLPKKLMKLGREGYAFSLVVTSSLVAIVAVPIWVEVMAAVFGRDAQVDPLRLAALIAKAFLGPLLLGMGGRGLIGAASERVSERLLAVAGVFLAVAAIALLALHGGLLFEAGWRPFVGLLSMTLVALAVGHLMGGPDPGDRTALAVSCATRHVGVAVLAASAVPGPKTAAFVLAYVLTAGIASAAYLRWQASAGAATATTAP